MKLNTYELWIGEDIGDRKMFCNVFVDREEAKIACKELQSSVYPWEVSFLVDGPTLDYAEQGVMIRERATHLGILP